MTNFKKQLWLYILLVFLSGMCFLAALIYPIIAQNLPSSNNIPQANHLAPFIEYFMFESNTINLPKIIIVILMITSPIWMFAGYYFSKKMNLPGIYKGERISKREILIMVVTCLVLGVVFPLLSVFILDEGDKIWESSIQIFFLQAALIILLEIFIRLFLFSIVLWALNLILKKYLTYNKIEIISIILNSIIVIIFLYNFRHFFSGEFSFENIHFNFEIFAIINVFSTLIANYMLCIIFIKNGILYSTITRFIIFILSSVVYWISL